MLSTKPIKNVEQAAHYFLGHDNYYTEENTLAQDCSQWWGKGAQALGLSGHVEPEKFTELLRGHLPNDQQLGKKVDGEIKHRPGFDLTFSVPKSVSILALLREDDRIFKSIEKATDKVLTLIEREQAKTRMMKDGVLMTERTGQLVVARFLHDLSRDGDPQLHTHCVVMNMTQRRDGKWRSLASQLGSYREQVDKVPDGFLESVRRYQKYYGAVFRAELAYEMRELGYQVEKTSAYGFFEIAGISKDNIKLYSERRREIESWLEKENVSGAKAAELATLKTRRPKQHLHHEEIKMLWETKAALKGLLPVKEAQQVVSESLRRLELPLNESKTVIAEKTMALADQAVREAIAHLSETRVALRETELITQSLYYSLNDVSVTAILSSIEKSQKNGDLILLPAEPSQRGDHHFTTSILLNAERSLLQAVTLLHSSRQSTVDALILNQFLKNHADLTTEQRQAIQTLFSSDKILMSLAGTTGSGKTHLLQPMMSLAKIGGYQPIILTHRATDALNLKEQLRKTPENLREWIKQCFDQKQIETVYGYLRQQEKTNQIESWLQRKPFLFIENATQLSCHQLNELMTCAQQLNGRLLLIGDPKAPLTWRAGTPFTQLLSHGMVSAHLTQNHHKTAAPIREALEHSLKQNIIVALDKIGHRLISIEDPALRQEAIGAHVAGLTSTERASLLVLAPNQSTAQALNLSIREALQNKGEIAREGISFNVLLPRYMRLAEQRQAQHYQSGQWIRFHKAYRGLKVHIGVYREIKGIDKDHNQLLLADRKGKIVRWNPEKIAENSIEVFDAKQRMIAVGDQLRCYRSDKKNGLVTGQIITVAGLTEKNITLKNDRGQRLPTLSLSAESSRHFDYGYALTATQVTSQSAERVIAYQNSSSRQSHQRSFYQLLAKAQSQAWIYTEDKAQLLATLQKQSGDKITALDILLQPLEKPTSAQIQNHSVNEHIQLIEQAVQKALQANSLSQPVPDAEAKAAAAVRYALAYLSEKEAAFAHKEVMTVALTHILGDVNVQALERAVLNAEKQGDLIRGVYSHNGTRWTTHEALTLERQLVALAQKDRGTLSRLTSVGILEEYLQKTQPSPEHTRVLTELSAQTDRVVLLQGFAGTGKTTLLQHVEILQHIQQVLKADERALLCLAPTHTAVKEIRERGLTGKTLDRFLLQFAGGKLKAEDYVHRLVVVDESSMISNRRLHDFLAAVTQLGARALLVGDIHQYTAIDAGKPFAVLQQSGVATLTMKHITRQQDPTLQAAVQPLYQKDFARVFEILEKNIIEVGGYQIDGQRLDNREERLEKIAADYLSRDPERRAQTLIITFGNQDRILQNALIREGLRQAGELSGEAVVSTILAPRQLSEVERSQVMHYKQGDILRFSSSDSALGIQKGDYWTVSQILSEHQRLELTHPDRRPVFWKPPVWQSNQRAGVEVYQKERRELMAGDLIRWTRTDEALGLLSPELARVESVTAGKVAVRSLELTAQGLRPQGEPIHLELGNPRLQHWDHAYAMTGYSAQGKTIAEVLINAESYRLLLTSQPSLLVALTRAVHSLTLYTDDKAALLSAILQNPGSKSSALEIMGEIRHPGISTQNYANKQPKVSQKRNAIPLTPDPAKTFPPRLDAQRISAMLTQQAEVIVERLMGEPKTKTAAQYRYGAHQGSLIVTLNGDKRGLWHDFQTGQGGHLLGLIALQKNLDIQRDFQAVLQEAVKLLGSSPEDISLQAPNHTVEKARNSPTAAPKTLTPEQRCSLHYARQLAQESQPVAGTLAERYLREHRGIMLEQFPEAVRFHPGIYSRKNEAVYPALLVVAKNGADQVQAVQAIFLDRETAQKADVPVKKQTWGQPSQASAGLLNAQQRASAGVTYLAEGVETAMSVYQALNGADVRVTLGKSNFKNIDPAKTASQVILCLDNDGQNPQSDQLIRLAARKLEEQGKAVWMVKPEITSQDYNDVLKEQGAKAVQQALEKAIRYAEHEQLNLSDHTSPRAQAIETISQQLSQNQVDQNNQIRQAAGMLSKMNRQPAFTKETAIELHPMDNKKESHPITPSVGKNHLPHRGEIERDYEL